MITRYIEITMAKNSHPKQHSQIGPPDLAQPGPIWNAAWIIPSSISYGPQLGQVGPNLGPVGNAPWKLGYRITNISIVIIVHGQKETFAIFISCILWNMYQCLKLNFSGGPLNFLREHILQFSQGSR